MTRPRTILVMGQTLAERHAPRAGDAVISITDAAAPPARLHDGWAAELRLGFDDYDPIESPAEPGEDLTEIGPDQAAAIAAFALGLPRGVRRLIVHCRHGQSRSVGVAMALAEHWQLSLAADCRYHNRYVYDQVRAQLKTRAPGG